MPDRTLWGAETEKAISRTPISGEPIPAPVIHWLGRIKAAMARVHGELGLLDADRAARIAAAADRVASGELDEQFPVDVFQTGSGTSSNMNANEVVATLAGPDVHPNDHVNLGQSSNDVFPSAVHLAALERLERGLVPALERLASSLGAQAERHAHVVKAGRTHLMDAVPMTLGQELGGFAAQARESVRRVRAVLPALAQVPLGGTAVGTGLNAHPELGARVRARLAAESGLDVRAPVDAFEAQAARDGLVEASGALRSVAVSLGKIAGDLRLLASGPRTGLGELRLPELQKGSSVMPGKVNPVVLEIVTQVSAQVIGNDQAVAVAGLGGQLELNAYVPVMARNVLGSIELLTRAAETFAKDCVDGLEVDEARAAAYAELTLATAAALNPIVGYERAEAIVREASRSGRPLREVALEMGVGAADVDRALGAQLRPSRGAT